MASDTRNHRPDVIHERAKDEWHKLLDELTLSFASFYVVCAYMSKDTWDLVDPAVDSDDRNFCINRFL